MTFKEWLEFQDLASSSVNKYSHAINQSISNWAIEEGLIDRSINTIRDFEKFKSLSESIRNLPSFKKYDSQGNNMYSSALKWYLRFLSADYYNRIENDIDKIVSSKNISATEKQNLLKARIGQGRFRKNLITYWNKCAVTGYQNIDLLVASHIKPWRESTNNERLDVYNGLLLLPNIDKAFDSGFITFLPNGNIKISSILIAPSVLGIKENMSIQLNKAHIKYLRFHKDQVFLGS